jgi:hypothetical protein
MKQEQILVIGTGLAIVALATLWEVSQRFPKKREGAEITPETLQIGNERPCVWLFYNDSEVNSRHWSDFMARSSRVINIPLLNTFYETIAAKNGDKYRIEVVGGLQGVAERLGGWDALPEKLRSPRARVSEAEEDWIRAAILAKYGGLWLSPSVICLKGFGDLPTDKIVAFGQEEGPLYGSPIPGFRALWSPVPNHPLFVEWEQNCRWRLDNQLGGGQVRKDSASDWVSLAGKYREDVVVCVKEELGRDPRTNKKLQLEDLFAAGTGGRLPFEIPATAIYVVVPYKDLLDRRLYGWVLRSSEEQILESDLVLAHILNGTN